MRNNELIESLVPLPLTLLEPIERPFLPIDKIFFSLHLKTFRLLHQNCGSNAFQGYFDDAKE